MNQNYGRKLLDKLLNYHNKEYLSYAFMIGATITWVWVWIYPNEHQFNFSQTTLSRGLPLAIISYLICYFQGYQTNLPNRQTYFWMIIRNFIMLFFSFVMAFSQFVLPLPIVHTISSGGIIFVSFWDYYLNGVSINKEQMKGIIASLVGMTLVVNGRMILSFIDPTYKMQTTFDNYKTKNPYLMTLMGIGFVLFQVVWAYGIVITKKIKANVIQVCTHQGILISLASGLVSLLMESKITIQQELMGFLTTGFLSTLNMYLFIGAIKLSKNTGIMMMITLTNVVWAYFVSIFRYGESQNVICILGILLVIGGVWKSLFSKGQT